MMSSYILHKRQVKKIPVESIKSSLELIASHPCHDEQAIAICKEPMALSEPNPEACPMMSVQHRMDDTPFVSPCLSGDGGKPEGGDEFSPFSKVSPKPRESRVSLIRLEFVELTNDPLIAAVLNQLVYWSQKVSDFDLFWEEETSSSHADISSLQYGCPQHECPQHGWFYKSANELLEETMVRVSLLTLRRYLGFLRTRGWIQTRRNSENKFDPKIQYRVSLRKLCNDLQKKGHTLPSFEAYGIFPHAPKDSYSKSKPEKTNSVAQDNTNSKERSL